MFNEIRTHINKEAMQQKHSFLVQSERKLDCTLLLYHKKQQYNIYQVQLHGKTTNNKYYVVQESQVRSLFHFHFSLMQNRAKKREYYASFMLKNIHVLCKRPQIERNSQERDQVQKCLLKKRFCSTTKNLKFLSFEYIGYFRHKKGSTEQFCPHIFLIIQSQF